MMEIDNFGENSDINIIKFNFDNLLNFDINRNNSNKNEYLESNNNCEIGFNTKIHDFYKKGELILKKSGSFNFIN